MNDLVSLLALPALGTGQEPPPIMATLLDVIVRMLRLDFAYARLNVAARAVTHEAVRVAPSQHTTPPAPSVATRIAPGMATRHAGAGVAARPRYHVSGLWY